MPNEPISKQVKRVVKRPVRFAAKDWALGVAFPNEYRRAASKCAVDPRKILFIEGKSSTMPDAFALMYSYLEDKYDLDISFIGLAQNEGIGWTEYYKRCLELCRTIASARAVFLADASDVVSCLPLRPETKVVQLWHACGAFKKWGFSTAELEFGNTRKQIERHPFYKNLSLVTVSSPEVAWAYREAMGLEDTPDVVQATGVSRTDCFFDEAFLEDAQATIQSAVPSIAGKKVLLYAPTFRGHVSGAEGPDFIDFEELRESIGDQWIVLVKHHPFVKNPPSIPESCHDFAFMVPDIPTDRLMAVADAMITDYSSVVFEYSLFERPIAFLAPDVDSYCDWRGFYYPYDQMTPGPVLKSTSELTEWMQSLDEEFDSAEVSAFRAQFMNACDGHATERIAELALGDLSAFEKPSLWNRMAQRNIDSPDLSIIIPAYNAEVTLARAIDSVVTQTYPTQRLELIVVDDRSSDGTWELLQKYADEHPELVIALQTPAQSGSPAEPRNIGLAQARGEYVFFLDADDWLGPEAVERMLGHALDWNSDVLLVKLRGEDGRVVPISMFFETQRNASLTRSKVMWTFAPLKLFKRSLLEGLEFPPFMPEDISFVLRAYVRANIISVAADYAYYHVAAEQGDSNASVTTWNNVDSNLQAYEDIFKVIGDNPDLRNCGKLMRRIFGRDIYNTLRTIGEEADVDRAQHQLLQLTHIVKPFYNPKALATLPDETRWLLAAAFDDCYDDYSPRADSASQAPRWWDIAPQESTADLTILVPVYNGARYLRQCLDSLSGQACDNIQIVCIDDGSTDETPSILAEYADRDSRFEVIAKSNTGYGNSMNTGLAHARGRYIGILESDDWMEEGTLESLLRLADENNHPDIVKANHYRFTDDGEKSEFVENYPASLCNRIVAPADEDASELIVSIPAIWAGIYRRDFLMANQIDFLETPGASYQDTGFVFKSWIAARTVYLTHEGYIHYRTGNEGSSTVSTDKVFCVLDEWAAIDEFAQEHLSHLDQQSAQRIASRLEAKRFQTYNWNLARIDSGHVSNFVNATRFDFIKQHSLGNVDKNLYSDKQWTRLKQWEDDPSGLVGSILKNRERQSAKHPMLNTVRKLRRRKQK